MKPAATPNKYAFIDAMRGIAFLGVLVFHTTALVPDLGGPLRRFADQGFEGVQLFFVVSALTMFLSLDARKGRESRPILNFYLRRFFRIAPLFYAAALFLILFGHRMTGDARFDAASIVCTFLFVHGWTVDYINYLVPGGWTIGVEMSFYLLVPLLYYWITTPQRAAWGVILSLLFAGAAAFAMRLALLKVMGTGSSDKIGLFLYYWLPMQLPIFFLGFCLYFLVKPLVGKPESGKASLATLLLLVSLYLFVALSYSETKIYLSHSLFGVGFVLLGWSLAINPVWPLVNPVTCGLGVISFSGYITHFGILALLKPAVSWLGEGFASMPAEIRMIALTLVATAGTACFSTITYYVIEKPGQRLGWGLINILEQRRA